MRYKQMRYLHNVIIPIFEDIEQSIGERSRYDVYFEWLIRGVGVQAHPNKKDKESVWITIGNYRRSVVHRAFFHDPRNKNEHLKREDNDIEENTLIQLIKDRSEDEEKDGYRCSYLQIVSDPVLYEAIKESWIGKRVEGIINWYDSLREQEKEESKDLLAILGE